MMKKSLMMGLILSLVLIPSLMSIEVTNQSREYMRYMKSVGNFTSASLFFDNFDNRNFYIKFLVVPRLVVQPTNDNIALWNPKLIFYKDHQTLVADTSSCWGWWNNASSNWGQRQFTDCPTISFEIDSNEDLVNITMLSIPDGSRAGSQYHVYYYGYSTAYANEDILYSETRRVARDSISDFFTLNFNMWRGGYYVLIIVILVVAVLFIVGGIPLMIKKLIVKVTGG